MFLFIISTNTNQNHLILKIQDAQKFIKKDIPIYYSRIQNKDNIFDKISPFSTNNHINKTIA